MVDKVSDGICMVKQMSSRHQSVESRPPASDVVSDMSRGTTKCDQFIVSDHCHMEIGATKEMNKGLVDRMCGASMRLTVSSAWELGVC